MLVNICMKFHEGILNGFKVIERTWFCHRTAYYKLQRDVTKKIHIQELWFLHSACHLLVLNICMKFCEYILNSFKVYRADTNLSRNCYLKSSKGRNSKSINTKVMVLVLCMSPYIGQYLYEVSWRYFERFSRHDFVTDRQTTHAKTICLSTLKEGDIMKSNYYY